MSDFRSSYISPSTYYSQLRNAIGYGREDEYVNVRQEGLWTVNLKKFRIFLEIRIFSKQNILEIRTF